MTQEEKQEIIAVIMDTIKSEIGIQMETKDLKDDLKRYIRQINAQGPFLCADVNCKNRKSCKKNV